MTFDNSLHPRDSLGQFSEKLGIAPEVVLHGADANNTGVTKHWPKLSDDIGLNGYSQRQVADIQHREDTTERRMRSWDALPSGNNVFPAAAADRTNEFERIADDQGIVAVSTHPHRLADGRYSHEMMVARDGFYGTVKGRFLVISDSAETPSAGEAIRQSINPPESMGDRAYLNSTARGLLFSSDEAGEERALLDSYVRSAQKRPSRPTSQENIKAGDVVSFGSPNEPGLVHSATTTGDITRIDSVDGRVLLVGNDRASNVMDRW